MEAQGNNFDGMFLDEKLPELEITIIPYKNKGKVQLELMNTDFYLYAKRKGIVDDDLLDKLSWKKVVELMDKLLLIVPDYRKYCEGIGG